AQALSLRESKTKASRSIMACWVPQGAIRRYRNCFRDHGYWTRSWTGVWRRWCRNLNRCRKAAQGNGVRLVGRKYHVEHFCCCITSVDNDLSRNLVAGLVLGKDRQINSSAKVIRGGARKMYLERWRRRRRRRGHRRGCRDPANPDEH